MSSGSLRTGPRPTRGTRPETGRPLRASLPRLLAARLSLATFLVACGPPPPPVTASPDLASAPAGAGTSERARRRLAEETASGDLECNEAQVVAALERQFSNSTTARYVIEGCGKRALYVENCEDLPVCRYLLVSVVPTRSRPERPATAPAPKGP